MAPKQAPPPRYGGSPHRFVLRAGTTLARVHSTSFDVAQFNPTVAQHRMLGGRFDSTPADPYAYLYAASDDRAAVSEVLLRDLRFDERGSRLMPRSQLSRLRIGWLAPVHDLVLVDLRSGQSLAAVAQDAWLTTCEAEDYDVTRQWSAAIRSWAPTACGMVWRSRREPDELAFVFFEDRCSAPCFTSAVGRAPLPPHGRDLGSGTGARHVEQILADYGVVLK